MGHRKSLIVGAAGQVGRQLAEALASGNGGDRPLETSRQARNGWLHLDLAELSEESQAAALLDAYPLDAIYCVGGMTYVDGCEADSDLAHRTNARGPGVLAAYANRRVVPFIYFSTEYLFAGNADDPGPYFEDSVPHPLNVYGESKLAGEYEVLNAHPGALVIRTTVVYGPDDQHKNFVYSVMRNLRAGRSMRVPDDQNSTPTYNRDLVSATLGLVAAGATGIFHVCGPEVMDRLKFARQVASYLGLDAGLLEGTSTAELNQTAKRPLFAGLATSKLTTLYPNLRMRTLSECLQECATELQRFLDNDSISN